MNNGPTTLRGEILQTLDKSWNSFLEFIGKLSEEQLTEKKDPQGWSAKDHIVHLAAWERSVEYFLQRKPRHLGLGVSKKMYLGGTLDDINDLIYRKNADVSLGEALTQLRKCHRHVVELISSLPDTELRKPYNRFISGEPEDNRKVFEVIYANTSGHLIEHLNWIAGLEHKNLGH
jgi:hypothetical protein